MDREAVVELGLVFQVGDRDVDVDLRVIVGRAHLVDYDRQGLPEDVLVVGVPLGHEHDALGLLRQPDLLAGVEDVRIDVQQVVGFVDEVHGQVVHVAVLYLQRELLLHPGVRDYELELVLRDGIAAAPAHRDEDREYGRCEEQGCGQLPVHASGMRYVL